MIRDVVGGAIYQHDCSQCQYLGTIVKTVEMPESRDHVDVYDLYFCDKQLSGPTVVVRYGNRGEDNVSGLPAWRPSGEHPEFVMVVAYHKAVEQGYIKEEEAKGGTQE